MKISVDGKDLFSLSETQKKVIMNEVHSDIFEDDMKRRLHYILNHKYQQCFKRLKEEWDKKLFDMGVENIPTNPDKYAELIFSHVSYKNRKQRDDEGAKIKEQKEMMRKEALEEKK